MPKTLKNLEHQLRKKTIKITIGLLPKLHICCIRSFGKVRLNKLSEADCRNDEEKSTLQKISLKPSVFFQTLLHMLKSCLGRKE